MPGFYATIARYYDAENADKTDDLNFYADVAEEYGGPILDVGCGTGRVVFHLAQAGYITHGIDSEYDMLERAKMKLDVFGHVREKLTFYQGDVMTYDLDKKYKMVLLSYNALMHFHTQEEQLSLLHRLRECILPDGLLIIDLPNAGETFASQDSDSITLERTFIEPETGHMVMQQSVSFLDRAQQLMEVTWIYDELSEDGIVMRTVAPIIFRYIFCPELTLLLKQNGFEVDEIYGDYDGGAFENGCERMIVLAKPI
ncbi:MAG: class I SAM-dependent methyltransferase [Anaerolineae bacterium]|nr:class I SAM-dependent methyltransferase [Anaerolineae bacterium]